MTGPRILAGLLAAALALPDVPAGADDGPGPDSVIVGVGGHAASVGAATECTAIVRLVIAGIQPIANTVQLNVSALSACVQNTTPTITITLHRNGLALAQPHECDEGEFVCSFDDDVETTYTNPLEVGVTVFSAIAAFHWEIPSEHDWNVVGVGCFGGPGISTSNEVVCGADADLVL